ncbi:MAG: hypothetical protein SFY80_14980 [Verrucomicrobiota bacterium]|nr:hypothetical protein [Verrucomicrobiota bacterium]
MLPALAPPLPVLAPPLPVLAQALPPFAPPLPPLAPPLPSLAQALPPLVQALPAFAPPFPLLAPPLPSLAQTLPPLAGKTKGQIGRMGRIPAIYRITEHRTLPTANFARTPNTEHRTRLPPSTLPPSTYCFPPNQVRQPSVTSRAR